MNKRIKSAVEAVIGLFLVFGFFWFIYPLYHTWIKVACCIPILLLFIWTKYSNNESFRDLGFRLDNWRYSVKFLSVFTLIAVPIIYVIWSMYFPVNNYFYLRPGFYTLIFTYPLGALLQEYLVLAFFFRRYRNIFTPYVYIAVFLSAITFALIHIPSPPLMILCFIGGLVWAYVYSKSPNIYIIAVYHGLFGLFVGYTLLVYFKVGPNADIGNWTKQSNIAPCIDSINNKRISLKKPVNIGNQCSNIFAEAGIIKINKDVQIKKVYATFSGKNYKVTPTRGIYHSFNIPLKNIESGYYRLKLKVYIETKYYSYIDVLQYWVHILP